MTLTGHGKYAQGYVIDGKSAISLLGPPRRLGRAFAFVRAFVRASWVARFSVRESSSLAPRQPVSSFGFGLPSAEDQKT